MENLLDYIKNELKISKKDLYMIPFWDRVRMSKLSSQPVNDPTLSHVHLLKRMIDGNRYVLHQIAIVGEKYVKYEEVEATIHRYVHNGNEGNYRTYNTKKEVWFYI